MDPREKNNVGSLNRYWSSFFPLSTTNYPDRVGVSRGCGVLLCLIVLLGFLGFSRSYKRLSLNVHTLTHTRGEM